MGKRKRQQRVGFLQAKHEALSLFQRQQTSHREAKKKSSCSPHITGTDHPNETQKRRNESGVARANIRILGSPMIPVSSYANTAKQQQGRRATLHASSKSLVPLQIHGQSPCVRVLLQSLSEADGSLGQLAGVGLGRLWTSGCASVRSEKNREREPKQNEWPEFPHPHTMMWRYPPGLRPNADGETPVSDPAPAPRN